MPKSSPSLPSLNRESVTQSTIWASSHGVRMAIAHLRRNPYNTTILSVGLATLLMLWLDPLPGMAASPFLLFFGAVAVSAWQGGIRSGLVATGLAAFISNYVFMEPKYTLMVGGIDAVRLLIFCLECALISVLCGSLRRTNQQLDRHVLQLKLSEESLQTLNQSVTDILESITDGFYTLDRQWRFTHINPQAEDVLGRSRDELLEQSFWEIFPEARGSVFEQNILRVFRDRQPVVFESHHFLHPTRWFEIHINPVNSGLAVYFQDVTERKRSQDELRLSENRYRTLANAVSQIMWINAADGSIQFFNQQWVDYTGIPLELSLHQWTDVIHPEDVAPTLAIRSRGIQAKEAYEMEVRLRRVDGMHRWHLIRVVPLKDEAGQVLNWFGTATDIHSVKQAEEALRQSEERFRLSTRAVDGVIYDWDLLTGQVFRSEGLYRLLGLEPSSIPDHKDWWRDRIHPEDLPRVEAVLFPVLQGSGDRYEFEYRIRHEDGHWIDVWDRGYLIRDSEGTLVRVVGSTADITKRKQMEESLKRSEERLRFAIEGAEFGTWDHDLASDQILWSERAQRIIGLSEKSIEHGAFFESIHPDDLEQTRDAINWAITQGEDYDVELRLVRPDGSIHWARFIGRAYAGEDKNPTRMAGIVFDITNRKHIEEERERLLKREQAAREAAEAANRVKDEFLAVLSHELRSPLNPILGWARLLQTQKLSDAKTAQALETIERNAKLQAELIEDLLDVSRILRGKLSLNTGPVDLEPTVRAAIETVRLAAEAKAIAISTALDPHVGQVIGDSNRLQQVVWNLLSNAVKFTPPGGRIEVRLEQAKGTDLETVWNEGIDEWCGAGAARPHFRTSSFYAQITVTDTGKGIRPDFLPHVFEYFRQADSATTRQHGGLGLGLAIVHHLVELHGGTVRVESPGEGLGSTFSVKLPLLKVASETVQDNHSSASFTLASLPLQDVRVLVVDDDQDTRDFITFVLQQAGATVFAAATALEALEVLPTAQPTLLLSDIGMPDMDGYMLIREVRARPPEQGSTIPAIALTAFAGEMNQRQALNAGFQKHISKPVEPESLIATIISLVKG